MGLVAVRSPGVALSAAGHVIVQGVALLGRQPACNLAHDRNDFLYDITAGAAGSTSQQILDRSADLCFGVVPAPQIPNRPTPDDKVHGHRPDA
jgi:hypothetical protein